MVKQAEVHPQNKGLQIRIVVLVTAEEQTWLQQRSAETMVPQGAILRAALKISSSNFKGVEFTKRKTPLDNPWRARITLNHKKVQLGYFPDPLNAAAAYDMAGVKLFGEFGYTNFARPCGNL